MASENLGRNKAPPGSSMIFAHVARENGEEPVESNPCAIQRLGTNRCNTVLCQG